MYNDTALTVVMTQQSVTEQAVTIITLPSKKHRNNYCRIWLYNMTRVFNAVWLWQTITRLVVMMLHFHCCLLSLKSGCCALLLTSRYTMSLPPDIEAIDPERRLTNEEELPPPWLSPEVWRVCVSERRCMCMCVHACEWASMCVCVCVCVCLYLNCEDY